MPRAASTPFDDFVRDGFVRLDEAFSSEQAAAMRSILWPLAGIDPNDPASWTRPVVRVGFRGDAVFREAANTPSLHAAYDALVGPGRWRPPTGLGTFPIRLPSERDPGDTGWHIDASFGTDDPDFLRWRANVASRDRALLLLFLVTDIGVDDAPTRLRVGSHRDVARQLAPAGDAGLTLGELAADGFARSAHRAEALATGPAGTVYLCHPFLVHAAQAHRGARPRILAQPPLLPARPFDVAAGTSPVERAIREGLRDDA